MSLRDLGESTEIVVDQRPFLTEERHALHDAGRSDALERLADVLT